jgi:hypothetical protein
MKKIHLLTISLCCILFSCQKFETGTGTGIDKDNLLIGVWNFSVYQDDAVVYTRSTGFADCYGYKFDTDGTLTERKNSGFCGTPPITYADYDGSWTIVNDTLISVNVGYWGGTSYYRLDIESVTENSLKVIPVYNNK